MAPEFKAKYIAEIAIEDSTENFNGDLEIVKWYLKHQLQNGHIPLKVIVSKIKPAFEMPKEEGDDKH